MFENYSAEAQEIEREIVRRGIALNIDWGDEPAVRALAREALAYHHDMTGTTPADHSVQWRAKFELFGLAQLMLKVMTESAAEDIETHGGPVWKAFGRALWREAYPQTPSRHG